MSSVFDKYILAAYKIINPSKFARSKSLLPFPASGVNSNYFFLTRIKSLDMLTSSILLIGRLGKKLKSWMIASRLLSTLIGLISADVK